MKRKQFFGTISLAWLLIFSVFTFTACDDDDDNGGGDDDQVLVEDGIYLKGAGTALTELSSDGRMKVTRNEVLQEERSDLLDIYIAVKAGADGFNIIEVAGKDQYTYGPGGDFAQVAEADLDPEEPKLGLWKGSYTETDVAFTVPEDGLYHVALDKELKKVAIAKVVWGLIGGATPGGWSENTPMTATFDLNSMEFVVEEVTMLENEYKFRYSDGWKVILDADYELTGGDKGIKVNSNFGGTLDNLVPGGDNLTNDTYGVYKYTMTWQLGQKTTASREFIREGEPLAEYPEQLYMIGNALNQEDSDGDGTPDGWQWDLTDQPMVPVHSNPHLFWKIAWLDGEGEFKFAPGREWVGDFGKSGDATDGVFAKGTDNVPVTGETGYYMIVVNLVDETIEVTDPMVYGIGDVFGSWDAAQEANLFTVDNAGEVIKYEGVPNDGELRLHVAAPTMTNKDGAAVDWWQAEFIILDGNIEFRGTGDDQDRVSVTAGQNIILNFKEGTGSIE